ncbi:hypothetical protein ENUP19_0203G0041 [Entamoeba nuttalli]|uniref:Importin alpha n=2 Tax=Entamoeba nuttalli TaxID=412467 RepID=K2HWU5_ENTNP|nr:hypothetical protein ENU1_080690 [Entamoeba nuttalli P19]EKE40740.1 hypothetical protein ENU1_080690 [Entamoeba nuttalli P19]|eukprot:XP_008856918.1 hypothetical protein ENU1_080690 [Entamoeba nuttalli P19]
MATLRETPNITSLCSQRREELMKMRMKRRNELLKRNVNNNQFEQLETLILQSDNPILLLTQNTSVINQAIMAINKDNFQEQLIALRLLYTIVSLQIEQCLILVQSSFPFLVFLLQSPSNEIVAITSKIVSLICQTSTQFKERFNSQGIIPIILEKLSKGFNEILTSISLIQLLSTLTLSNPIGVKLLLNSQVPQALMQFLPTTNNTKFISSSLLLISLISSDQQFISICINQMAFLQYLAVILTTSIQPTIIAPTLTIIGNFFTISTPSQLAPFLTPNVIDGLIRIVQRDNVLMSDAVWVLGNLVSATNFEVVSKVVQSGCLPLLFGLFDNTDDDQLISSLFVTISNIMASDNNGSHPFIKCCLELGILEYLIDYLKDNQTNEFIMLCCDILKFLFDTVPDLYQRLKRINAIELLTDLAPQHIQIRYLLDQIQWRQ